MRSTNQSRVQKEGHKEDRVANNGPFNKLSIYLQWGHFCDLLFYISMTYLHRAASGEYIENQIVVYPIDIIVLFR